MSASYTTPSTIFSDNGSGFRCVVSDANENIVSDSAILIVNPVPPPPPIITQEPTDQTVTEPDPATFTVGATGTSPLFYQWRRNEASVIGSSLFPSPGNLIASVGNNLPAAFEASRAMWHETHQKLFVVHDGGSVAQMDADGGNVVTWTPGSADLEGICLADPSADFVYLGVERAPVAIQEFNVTTGQVTRTFSLERWMGAHGNNGLEALTFVPTASHPEGGLFYAGLQADGRIFVFSLPIQSSSTVLQ